MQRFCNVVVAAFCLWLMAVTAAVAKDSSPDSYKRFLGHYKGESISTVAEGLAQRDFDVTISPFDERGFTVKWTTIIRDPDQSKSQKRKTHTISFIPVKKRPGLYHAAAERDVFGKMVPADPFGGEPLAWAGIEGNVLNVSALYVRDDGGYEIQVYRRTLTAKGFDFEFARVRDGVKLRSISGWLVKLP